MKRFHKRHRHRILSQRRLESLESRAAPSGVSPGDPEDYPDLPEDVFAPAPEVDELGPTEPFVPFDDDGDLPFVPPPLIPVGPGGPG